MPFVGDTIFFAWQLQKGGINTAPGTQPTGTLISPSGSAIPITPVRIDGGSVPGAYEFSIANAVAGTYLAWLHSSDITFDEPDIPNGITVDAVQGSSPSAIATAVWSYIITAPVTAAQMLAALYSKIIFVNPPNSTNTYIVPVRLDISPIVPPAEYVINTQFTLTSTFRDSSGALIDPSTVLFWSLPPVVGSSPVALTPVTHVSTGIYTAPWTPGTPGNWELTVKTTGPAIHLADQTIAVQNSFEP